MNPSLDQIIQHFRTDYKGPPIAFFISGGGYSALDFRKIPGSSRFFHTAIEPYNVDTANFLNQFASAGIQDPSSFRFVNAEGTAQAVQALSTYCQGNTGLLYCVINSACTTDRFRKGDNRAFIATSRGDMYLFQMTKLEEAEYEALFNKNPSYIDWIRAMEDRRIGQVALALILEDPSLFPVLEVGESVNRMHSHNGHWVVNANDVIRSH